MLQPLWPAPPPLPSGHEPHDTPPEGAIADVRVPVMDIRRPDRPNGMAVLLLGGGGYRHIQIGKETRPAADWLLSLGVLTADLHYRLPGEGWPPQAPLDDLRRALRLLRAQAGELGVDPARLGVMGFSAGGHLAGLAASDRDGGTAGDAPDALSGRPDFAALIFPVVSLLPPLDGTRTRQVVAGADPGRAADWSVERLVGADSPPCFIAHAADDPVAAPEHSLLLEAALRRHGVPAEFHLFPTGGHGRAFGHPGTRMGAWTGLFQSWCGHMGFLPGA